MCCIGILVIAMVQLMVVGLCMGAVDEIGHAVAFVHLRVVVDLLGACLTAVLALCQLCPDLAMPC